MEYKAWGWKRTGGTEPDFESRWCSLRPKMVFAACRISIVCVLVLHRRNGTLAWGILEIWGRKTTRVMACNGCATNKFILTVGSVRSDASAGRAGMRKNIKKKETRLDDWDRNFIVQLFVHEHFCTWQSPSCSPSQSPLSPV